MKQKWLPREIKGKRKCPKCKGSGRVLVFDWFKGQIDFPCGRCGGKGF
jgi:hypothetical protein